MSADLFAEFGTESSSNQQPQGSSSAQRNVQPVSTFSFFDDLSTTPAPVTQWQPPPSTQNFQSFKEAPAPAPDPPNDDADDWGDFEGGPPTFELDPPAKLDPFAFSTHQTSQPPPTSQSVTSSTQDPFAFYSTQPPPSTQTSWQKAPILKAKKPADSSVLFDAEEEFDEEDDFGDFEGTESIAVPTPPVGGSSALVDLLGDMNVSQNKPPVASKKGGDDGNRKAKPISVARKSPLGGFGTVPTPKPLSSGPTAQEEDDSWETFDDWEASIPTKTIPQAQDKPKATKPTYTGSAAPMPILSSTSTDPQPGELPPTNVPPPGVLLSLFPPLFAEAQDKLFKPMAAQTLPMRNKLLAEPATIEYLKGYLMLASVAAHIIAGRKLRWKRDQHLSQGMRIGPASSRATSGMKLTGIDKGENLKEEREVSDVVRAWKEQVGRLRHVVSGANQIRSGTLDPVPDLQEVMPVKTLKQSEGGIPARQACMLCGLKRDERVTAADMEVDDSFGEWWIDQVNMHRGGYLLRHHV